MYEIVTGLETLEIVFSSENVETVLEVGPQGPAGPQGDGLPAGVTFTRVGNYLEVDDNGDVFHVRLLNGSAPT